MERSSWRLAIVAMLAGIWLGSSALRGGAATPTPLLTYITGLGSSNPPQVVIAAPDGSSPHALGDATNALLSPNGSEVAAINGPRGSTTTSTLVLYDTTGSTPPRQLAHSPQFMRMIAWSPDSSLLLVLQAGASTASTGHLVVFDTANPTAPPATVATGAFDGASFAPDGSNQIVFARANKTAVNLFVTSASGAGTRQLTHDGRSEYPVWGAKGIAYSHMTARAKSVGPSLQLWLIKPGNGSTRGLTNIPVQANLYGLAPIAFSSDGTHLLANYVGPDHAEAYTLDLSNLSSSKRLSPRDLGAGTIPDAISLKGDVILITRGTLDDQAGLAVETIRWGGGKPTVIVAHGAYASWDQ